MTNSVTVSAPTTGTVNAGLAITGAVVPGTDVVSLQLSQQNTTLPSGAWTPATTNNGAFAGVLVPPAAGTWYVWAWDQLTGLSAVSAAINVPNPALPYTPAAPLSIEQGESLLDSPAAGVTIDQVPAAGPASDTDTFLVGQGTKSTFAQTLAALWIYIAGKLLSFLYPQVTVTSNVSLQNPDHNFRVLVVTAAGVTITPLLTSLGAGFTCRVINNSGSTVALSSISTSTGATTIANGNSADLTAFTNSGNTLTVYAKL